MFDAFYRKIFDLNPESLLLLDDRGVIITANRAALHALGYAAGELRRKPFRVLLTTGSYAFSEPLFGKRPERAEIEKSRRLDCLRKDGSALACELGISRLDGRGPARTIVSIRRPSRVERKQTVPAHNEVDFRALIENSLDIVTLLEPDGTIRLQSPSAEAHLGYQPKEMVGRNVFDFVHPEDRDRVFKFFSAAFQEALQNPQITKKIQFRATHRTGTPVVLEAIGRLSPAIRASSSCW